MALNIKSLNPVGTGEVSTTGSSTYTDLSLEMSMKSPSGRSQVHSNSFKSDLKLDTDYKAISNSLLNIFNTSPGEKILSPNFGADLRRYLFEPVSEQTGQIIGDVILKAVKLYEPRVLVDNINILAFPENNTYQIDVYLKIPALNNKDFTFTGTLSDAGVASTGSY